MDKNLIDIVENNIKSNQVALLAEVHEDGTCSLAVSVAKEGNDNEQVEKETRVVAMAFNGVLTKFGDAAELAKLAELGAKVFEQQAALQEAEKD